MNETERREKIESVLKVSDDMGAKAKLVVHHMAAREKMTERQRRAADLEFMMTIGDNQPFWALVHRAFEYMRDTAKVTAEVLQEETLRPRPPSS